MLILDIDQWYDQIVMGAAIILAVMVDQAKSRLSRWMPEFRLDDGPV